MNRLYFDTETTGFQKAKGTPLADCPHLVQLAALLVDADGNEIDVMNAIVRPVGYTIPDDVAEIHGITTERALEEGRDLLDVIENFAHLLEQADEVVAHNINFDIQIVSYEFDRLEFGNLFAGKSFFCTMAATTDLCQLPGKYPGKFKWPKLIEAHQHIFGEGFDGAHDALADVRACQRIHSHLLSSNTNQPPKPTNMKQPATATTTETLPVIVIEAKGEIITSNLPAFAEAVRARLAEISDLLRTDEDFDQAAGIVKAIKAGEESLAAAKEKALQDAEQLYATFSLIDELKGKMAEKRLALSKQIDRRKEQIRGEIITGALTQIDCAPHKRSLYRGDLEASLKGLKTIDSMREKIRIQLSVINDRISRAKRMIDQFTAEHGTAMVMDRDNLEVSDPVGLEVELRRRVESAQAEAERKRIREENDRLRREAAEKAAAEAEAKRQEQAAQAVATPEVARTTAAAPKAPVMIEPQAPANPPSMSEGEEWEDFRGKFLGALAPVKAARMELVHPVNIARAERLANLVSQAWKEIQS